MCAVIKRVILCLVLLISISCEAALAKNPVYDSHYEVFYSSFQINNHLKGYKYSYSNIFGDNAMFAFDVTDGIYPKARICLVPTPKNNVDGVLILYNCVNSGQHSFLTNVARQVQYTLFLNDKEIEELALKIQKKMKTEPEKNGRLRTYGIDSVWCKESNRLIYGEIGVYTENNIEHWSIIFQAE